MKQKYLPLMGLASLVLVACNGAQNSNEQTPNSSNTVSAEVERLQSHLTFLADDLLEGRDTGSHGHEIASLYIASEFSKYGLTPAGDNGTYLQRIQFRQSYLDQASPVMSISHESGTEQLSYPNDFLVGANAVYTDANVQGEMVFVGYGIVAPELDHDDYQGIDVKDKIVVTLAGKPKSFPSEEGAHFGSRSEKRAHAVKNGAIGFITISTPTAEKVRPYQNLLNYIHTPSVRWLDDNGQPKNVFPQIKNAAYLSQGAAEKLFVGAQQSLADIYAQLENDESPAGFPLAGSVTINSRSEHKQISSPNVVGIVEGSDPKLKNEYIVYSAHSDHIGIARTVKKDKINNGAMDNATGTSVMLETARLFSQAAERPKRSILFVAVTGEEKGLLGSDYYAQNPTVPHSAMVANVNLDMPILTYEFADVIAFGANHSDMQSSVAAAAEKIGLKLSPDPWPEQALFTRSDHYSFVKQGIPSIFIVPGLESADPNIDGSAQFGKFISTNYHKPSDDLNQAFNWKAAVKFTLVNYEIGNTLANQEKRSSWNDGDFFGNTFAK